MEPVNLKDLPLLARGGQADIYALGPDRILRFPRRAQDFGRIRYEYEVLTLLAFSPVAVPRARELVEIEGSPSIVMDRIDGLPMTDLIRRNPFAARKMAADLASLHLQVLGVEAAAPITDAKDKGRYCIERADPLGPEDKRDLMRLLETLPGGKSLCHGDFHPGNILYRAAAGGVGGPRPGGAASKPGPSPFIIDWSSASFGDFHCDVAHTYLLLKLVPRVPGVGAFEHSIQRRIGRIMAGAYLDSIARRRRIDFTALAGWLLVKTAERIYYGLPSEKERLKALAAAGLEITRREGTPNQFFKLV
jgi:hypothetical protein